MITKYSKRVVQLTALALSLLLLCSCAKTADTTEKDTDKDTVTDAAEGTDTEAKESIPAPKYPEYDFSTLDLAQYVTLPADYATKDYKEGLELHDEATDDEVVSNIRSTYLLALAKYPETSAGADAVVQDLDRVVMDYTGKLDGVAFQGGTAVDTEHDISVLYSSFIDGFDRGMLGMKQGETRDLNLKFPENYQNSELAGKSVVFTITVDKIIRPEIPELTDTLITENPDIFGAEIKNAEELKASVKKSINESNKAENNKKIAEAVLSYLQEKSTFPSLPEDMKKGYEDYFYNYYLAMADSYNTTLDELIMEWGFLSIDAFKQEAVVEQTETELRIKLITHAAAKGLGINVTDKQAEDKAREDYKNNIEPNIMYYSMYYGISSFETYLEYTGGIYGHRENLLYNTVLEKLSGTEAE